MNMYKYAEVTDMEAKRKELGQSVDEFYAIPKDPPSASKLPIFDEAHVRNALARFNQVKDISEEEKKKAWNKILAKAKQFGIQVGTGDNEMSEFISGFRKNYYGE